MRFYKITLTNTFNGYDSDYVYYDRRTFFSSFQFFILDCIKVFLNTGKCQVLAFNNGKDVTLDMMYEVLTRPHLQCSDYDYKNEYKLLKGYFIKLIKNIKEGKTCHKEEKQ